MLKLRQSITAFWVFCCTVSVLPLLEIAAEPLVTAPPAGFA
jgi:hypothetical protein